MYNPFDNKKDKTNKNGNNIPETICISIVLIELSITLIITILTIVNINGFIAKIISLPELMKEISLFLIAAFTYLPKLDWITACLNL